MSNLLSHWSEMQVPQEAYGVNITSQLYEKLLSDRIGHAQVEQGFHSDLLVDEVRTHHSSMSKDNEVRGSIAVISGEVLFSPEISKEDADAAQTELCKLDPAGDYYNLIVVNMENVDVSGQGVTEIVRSIRDSAKDEPGPMILFISTDAWSKPSGSQEDDDPIPELLSDFKHDGVDVTDSDALIKSIEAGPNEDSLDFPRLEKKPDPSEIIQLIRFGAVIDKSGVSVTFINQPEQAASLSQSIAPKSHSGAKPEIERLTNGAKYNRVVPRPLGHTRLGELGQVSRD